MAKELLSLNWVEDLLPKDCHRKRMFGGFAYYLDEKLILVMFESEGNRSYRGEKFDFEIWNGCMFPAEKSHHEELKSQFPFLINHPILPKWLYLPMDTEDFDGNIESVLQALRRRDHRLGTIPDSKKPKKNKKENWENIDTRTPRMFSDAEADTRLQTAKKISDLKNLGPEFEKACLKAGIKTAPQLIKLGWKKAMVKLCQVNAKYNHSLYAYALIAALRNVDWSQNTEEDKVEAREFMKSLREKPVKKKKRKS